MKVIAGLLQRLLKLGHDNNDSIRPYSGGYIPFNRGDSTLEEELDQAEANLHQRLERHRPKG